MWFTSESISAKRWSIVSARISYIVISNRKIFLYRDLANSNWEILALPVNLTGRWAAYPKRGHSPTWLRKCTRVKNTMPGWIFIHWELFYISSAIITGCLLSACRNSWLHTTIKKMRSTGEWQEKNCRCRHRQIILWAKWFWRHVRMTVINDIRLQWSSGKYWNGWDPGKTLCQSTVSANINRQIKRQRSQMNRKNSWRGKLRRLLQSGNRYKSRCQFQSRRRVPHREKHLKRNAKNLIHW